MMQTPQADTKMIRRALAVMRPGGGVTELRVMHTNSSGTVSGYFDDMTALKTAAAEWSGNAPGVYITLNPVKLELLARAANRARNYARGTTSDVDIVRRVWLPVDIDPVRPSGISSTDAEHDAALAHAKVVRDWLRAQGFPEPVSGDSGNGAHLLYAIDLPNDDASRDLVQQALTAIAFHFNTAEMTIDTSVANAARIWKVYGTLAAKGDATPERPHRLARLLHVPKTAGVVSAEVLRTLAGTIPTTSKSPKTESGDRKIEVAAWLNDHSVAIARTGPWQGAVRWILETCPWNAEHTNQSAYVVQFASGAVAAGCHHAGCAGNDWHALRDLLEPGWRDAANTGGGAARPSVADRLVEIGQEAELFHDEVGNAFARIRIAGHAEIHLLRSKGFKRWLRIQYFTRYGKAPTGEGVDAALALLEALAVFQGERHELQNRVAQDGNDFLYDLTDDKWRAVRITAGGWSIESEPPITLRRFAHQAAQVEPSDKGDLKLVLKFLNIRREDEPLLLTWLVAAFVPEIAHPIPDLHGEKGAGKTFGERVLRRIIDPSAMQSLTFPSELKELVQVLAHHYCPLFDNVDSLPAWLSDALCRAVTGEGFSKRELYSDDDDVIYKYRRVILLNGINVSSQRPDLLDRSILIRLDRIERSRRRPESEMWEEFERALPQIMAGVFDTLSSAMKIYPTLALARHERMADFTRWGAAISVALGYDADAFIDAYSNNVGAQSQEAIDGNLVGSAIVALMESQSSWSGSPTDLLQELETVAVSVGLLRKPPPGGVIRQRGWPGGPHILMRRVNEIRSNLLDLGIEVTETKNNTRQIAIRRSSAANAPAGGGGSTSTPSVINLPAAGVTNGAPGAPSDGKQMLIDFGPISQDDSGPGFFDDLFGDDDDLDAGQPEEKSPTLEIEEVTE